MAFNYQFPVPTTDPNCKSTFTRVFHHDDWVDGQDVVQAQQTSEEEGFNARFHKLERDVDALGENLKSAFAAIEILRGQVVAALNDIKNQFNAKPPKEGKEGKDFKDQKDGKDGKDGKDAKDAKDAKDGKDGKDGKDAKDQKDAKDGKDHKDHKDSKDGKDGPEKILGAAEKQFDNPAPALWAPMADFLWREAPGEEPTGRAFIRPNERPAVGALTLARLDEEWLDREHERFAGALAEVPALSAELAELKKLAGDDRPEER
jgi:hypothetical protein